MGVVSHRLEFGQNGLHDFEKLKGAAVERY